MTVTAAIWEVRTDLHLIGYPPSSGGLPMSINLPSYRSELYCTLNYTLKLRGLIN